jgi:hypothetical protein
MPIGVVIAIAVLLKKVHATTFSQYLFLAFLWTTVAMLCDYFLLVKLINPPDGYYKLDVYLYYTLTFALPLLIAWRKKLL